ncbi:MAG: hypothetical protein CENE_01514 [Candidatus Celerinatantimonas neptuna]|nr:MAG: hypothetical protein CENE_01514 [Candidatus Celerinatantimonas neptuna]
MAIYCDIDSVIDSICESLGDGLPFLGAFTFGEQGLLLTGENGHGILMSMAVVFYPKAL